jgi:hypothetical protein
LFVPQAEQLSKVERWSLLGEADLAAALQLYPHSAGKQMLTSWFSLVF